MKNTLKKPLVVALILLIGVFVLCLGSGMRDFMKTNSTVNVTDATYTSIVEVEDWSACTTKLIINLGEGRSVKNNEIDQETFNVYVDKYQEDGKTRVQIHDPADTEWKEPDKMVDVAGGNRKVTKAYVLAKDGNPVDESCYITVDLENFPDDILSSALYSDGVFSSKWAVCEFKINQQKDFNMTADGSDVKVKKGNIINESTGQVRKIVDEFKTGSFTNAKDNVTLTSKIK